MKKMTCRDLGGACDIEFKADTFEEMAELSKNHAMKMYKCNEPDHMKAMGEMSELMKDPEAIKKWYEGKKKEFAELKDE